MKLTCCLVLPCMGTFLVGCGPSLEPPGYRLLLSPDGKEYELPTAELVNTMFRSSQEEQKKLVGQLVEVLQSRGSYSRLVAASALLDFFDKIPRHRKFLTKEVAQALARNTFQIAELIPPGEIVERELKSTSAIAERELKGLRRPIDLHMGMEVDCRFIRMGKCLPHAWRAKNITITIDDQVIYTDPAVSDDEYVWVRIDITDHLKGKKLFGKHRIVSRCTIISPNGHEVPIWLKQDIEIITDEEWLRRARARLGLPATRPETTE